MYFNRLTEIISCNLTEVLQKEADPAAALPRVIAEMEEGLQGALRSVGAASSTAGRIAGEIDGHRRQIEQLVTQAKQELAAGREADARELLVWKREHEDLVAGLNQQHQAAVNTRDHLTTTVRAVESRLAEARRRLAELRGEAAVRPASGETNGGVRAPAGAMALRGREIDAELEELKREVGR